MRTCGQPSNSRYINCGCRCDMCKVAHSEAEYRRAHDEGVMVDAEPIREHVEHLLARGWSKRQIARAAMVNRSALHNLLIGHHRTGKPITRMAKDTAELLMSVGADRGKRECKITRKPHQLMSAAYFNRRLAAMLGRGMTRYQIAKASGIPLGTIYSLGASRKVTALTDERLRRADKAVKA